MVGIRENKMIQNEIIPVADAVDIWRIPLDLAATDIEKYHACLNEEELARAAKLKIREKQNQFVVSRAYLKTILSRILDKETRQIKIQHTAQGKPYIKEQYQGEEIHFNLSHSETQAIIALTLSQEIGIDIQKIEANKDYTSLSQRFFSTQEKVELEDINADNLSCYFYTCWARKEAFIKAVGEGLAYGLNNFDVSVEPECTLSQIKLHQHLENNLSWFNITVDCEPGYAAALAISDPAVNLRYRTIIF